MKKHISIIAATVVASFLLVLAAQAQTSSAPRLTATIPFEFNARDQVWPAGEYTVTCLNPASPNRVLRLSGKDGRSIVMQTTNTIGDTRDNGRLVFHRYGDKYFLSQAWLPADDNGLAIRKSRSEKEMERQLAGLKVRTTTIAMSTINR
jgi:hypothetical protein